MNFVVLSIHPLIRISRREGSLFVFSPSWIGHSCLNRNGPLTFLLAAVAAATGLTAGLHDCLPRSLPAYTWRRSAAAIVETCVIRGPGRNLAIGRRWADSTRRQWNVEAKANHMRCNTIDSNLRLINLQFKSISCFIQFIYITFNACFLALVLLALSTHCGVVC